MKITYKGDNAQQLSGTVRVTKGENNISREEWDAIKGNAWTKRLIQNGHLKVGGGVAPKKNKKKIGHTDNEKSN